MAESKIKFITKDDEQLEFDREVAQLSELVEGLMDDHDIGEGIPLLVSSKMLKKVMQYCGHVKEHGYPFLYSPLSSSDFALAFKEETT